MSLSSDLKVRLEQMGLEPKKALGQNFLINAHVIKKITDAALASTGQLLEIGPGLGALTEPLIEAGRPPALIELDTELVRYWRGRGLEVTEGDALRLDWPAMLATNPATGDRFVLVSNLPYNISTSLVMERAAGPEAISHMILMFQREVAERLTAKPQTKAYGLLSVITQWHFEVRKIVDAAPRDFHPAPKVASRVLGFRRLDERWDPRRLTFLRGAFAFRRKFLLKNLKAVVDETKHVRMTEALLELGFTEKARAEELGPEALRQLFDRIYGN